MFVMTELSVNFVPRICKLPRSPRSVRSLAWSISNLLGRMEAYRKLGSNLTRMTSRNWFTLSTIRYFYPGRLVPH